ncbi:MULTISPECIES: amidohydrolase [unclassified Shinella]|uniref:amidohydrolase n=1 Tax=unclassified Shinella TaxID=2643062 RepID=UPI00225DC776|nr:MULTISPECIES: amidohydrolase [unclassified Shinella]MCO5138872.1 amidohydrolase [Shinella sp.]MDC7255710.1 amidohydrolase [Shinella sp. YE25]CAI0338521.1 Amidohydro_3 domain-containing protein [Rhizobiaceae bacterium]CAK7256965.1 Amidohydrolase 3 domain-containing protein [Shinella sp. WSC3-e]
MRSLYDHRPSHAARDAHADLVLTNGRIYTGDPGLPWCQSLAVSGGRIVARGERADVEYLIGPQTRIKDLGGRFAMPGLYDMHTHPDLALAPRYAEDLDIGIVDPTPDQVRDAVLAYAARHPDREWIYGQYFVRYTFRQAGLVPGRDWLDNVLPDRPVALLDRMWGTMMVNSEALRRAGIGAETPDPPNGYLERDPISHEPTGLLIDGAYALIHAAMPPTPVPVLRAAYRDGVRYQSARGVVATKYVHVCENRLEALQTLDQAGELTLRVEAAISWQDDIFPVRRRWELLAGERHYYRSARLNANAVKFHFDGTVEPRSSYLMTPWDGANSAWRGKLNLTPEHLADMVWDMDRQGIRVIAHCTGDAASDTFLDAVEAARRRPGGLGVRHQCAHSTILHGGNLKRFRELNVTAEFSPVSWYPSKFVSGARSGYGPERLSRAYNIKGVLEAGGVAVVGTDWPVSPLDPWIALETMVTRANPWGETEGRFGEPISLTQAIDVMTRNGAWSMGIEHEAGTLEIGKSADIIVLDRNLFEIEPQGNIHSTRVDLTFMQGQLVHDRLDAASEAIWHGEAPKLW